MLGEARRLAAEGRRVVVVVLLLDRLGRRVLERVRSREELKALGIVTHSVREGGEVSDLVANILASVAEEESRRTGERVGLTVAHLRAHGWLGSGRLPWGYRYRDATEGERADGAPKRVPELDPDSAPWALEAFRRIAGGTSIRRLALWAGTLPAAARQGRRLVYPTLQATLRSPTYVGRLPDGAPACWPALVDVELWERVQASLAGHRRLPKQASGRWLLTGFLRCPLCGGRMGGLSVRRGAYVCYGQARGTCSETVRARPLDQQVLAAAAERVRVLEAATGVGRRRLEAAWEQQRRGPDRTGADEQRAAAARVAEQARERLRSVALLYADRAIDRQGYELVRDHAAADLAAAERVLEEVGGSGEPALPPLAVVLARLEGCGAALRGADVGLQREALRELVERVSYRRVRRGEYVAEIRWTRLGEALGRS
jgi:hypothetical protein